jgi:hypothetical protein
MTQPERRTLAYRYRFRFVNGSERRFEITLDFETLALITPPRASYPSWTALSFEQCPQCPLDADQHPRCPVAERLVDVVEVFRDWHSYDVVETTVESRNRGYYKRTSLQEAASALLGIINVSSGCPILNKLRPMLGTHLPFMDSDESAYRTIANYLIAQHFLHRRGRSADWDLVGLRGLLHDCHQVNACLVARLRSLAIQDAILNALAVLNMHGELTSLTLTTDDLARWERIFLEHYH